MSIEKKINNLNKELLFFDGAMGTTLQKRGLKFGEVSEKLNLTKPDLIASIHMDYYRAGADIIKSNTFQANTYKLNQAGLLIEDVIPKAMSIAKTAAQKATEELGKKKYVALDIGPIGQMLEPVGTLKFDDAYGMFKEQVELGVAAGADLILIETISDLYEMKAAILAAKENSDLPVFCTMTFQDNQRTLTGTDPVTLVFVLESLGVDALGVNCSLGPKEIFPIVKKITEFANIPVLVQPNAGLPVLENGQTVFKLQPEDFAKDMKKIADLGVKIIGSCCGTTPEFTKLICAELKDYHVTSNKNQHLTTACSSSKTIFFDNEVVIIGERINPSGKKNLKEALKNNNIDLLLREGIKQKEAGADILDVNVGIPGIDEKKTLVQVSRELQEIVDLPLQFDSSNAKAIAAAMRYYNGKPIINSVTGKSKHLEEILPIVKKYGCMIIGLCLDEEGLPKTVKKRVEIAEKIIKTAQEYNIPKENLLIDCLTLTASAQQNAVLDSLNAITIIKKKFGVKTTLGASNISFGLPKKEIINQTYLAMALTSGLDAPITDPTSNSIMKTIDAYRVLANIDEGAKKFIDKYKDIKGNKITALNTPESKKTLKNMIIDGMKSKVASKTVEELKKQKSLEIVNKILIPALDIVGDRYESGEIFLPQLIRSAETVKIAFEVLKEKMIDTDKKQINRGKILLATVSGDVHDIGKNIVKILLENYGFQIIDLGKDVEIEKIISTIKKRKISLVGLSALMTTTVISLEKTIKEIRKNKLNCKIMIGGAVLTEAYSKEIGADFYGKDAKSAIQIAKIVFQ